MYQKNSSGIFAFFVKFIVITLIFGGFPVFLAIIVRNYNRQAEGIITKQNTLESIQTAASEEVKVLNQEDAKVLQNINQYIIGDWKSVSDTDYKIRFENDNTFTESKSDIRIGYGLWRPTVYRKPIIENISTSTDESYVTSSESVYKILRYQFESGKKSEPIFHRILFLSESKMVLLDADNNEISFER